MADRKLASIKKIDSIHPIEGADNIERAVIGGWNVVTKKGEFKEGDPCVYIEIDSLLPEEPQYEFLRRSSWRENLQKYRLRTVKLRGVISQGLALPLSSFNNLIAEQPIGTDLTEVLQIEKYEPAIPASLSGDVKGKFPSFIPKTDEERVQNVPEILKRHPDTEFVITEKVDGTSSTYYWYDGEFGFCGRNWEFKPTTENTYSHIAKKYNLENGLREMNLAIQGEILGPGIQGNKYKLSEHKFFAFHAYNIDEQRYLDHEEFIKVCDILKVEHVPVLNEWIVFKNGTTVEDLLDLAEGMSYLYKTNREGIVIKSRIEQTDPETGRLSFKVISNKFLMKHEE